MYNVVFSAGTVLSMALRAPSGYLMLATVFDDVMGAHGGDYRGLLISIKKIKSSNERGLFLNVKC